MIPPISRRPSVPTLLVACAVITAVLLYLAPEPPDSTEQGPLASTSQVGEAPVAEIGYLPDSVSNVTSSWSLSAVASYDPDGNITSYLWTVEHEGTFVNLTRAVEPYPFEETGLYKITLTVTDDDGNTGTAFTAVYSFSDADKDNLPDWWEDKYLNTLSFGAEDDPDQDGYTNLEEYARHTNPLVVDSRESFIEAHWRELALVAAAAAIVVALVFRRQRRRRKEDERRKIEYAIEIQKALDEE